MTYRDPLYDSNARPEGSTLEDEIEITVDEQTIVGDLTPGGSDTMSARGNQASGGQGKQAVDQAEQKGKQAMSQAKNKGKQAANQAEQKGKQALNQAEQKGEQAKQKASQMGDQAEQKADQGIDKAASGLSTAADKLQEQGQQQGGQMGEVAGTAAEKLDSASGYLQQHDTSDMVNDLEGLIRRKPVESLLVAAGVGFLLSRALR